MTVHLKQLLNCVLSLSVVLEFIKKPFLEMMTLIKTNKKLLLPKEQSSRPQINKKQGFIIAVENTQHHPSNSVRLSSCKMVERECLFVSKTCPSLKYLGSVEKKKTQQLLRNSELFGERGT